MTKSFAYAERHYEEDGEVSATKNWKRAEYLRGPNWSLFWYQLNGH